MYQMINSILEIDDNKKYQLIYIDRSLNLFVLLYLIKYTLIKDFII